LCATQEAILRDALGLICETGLLVYVTCSMLKSENDDQIDRFLSQHPGWAASLRCQWLAHQGADGFFAAHLTRAITRR
ncbi:MAG: RsmB/NOP family class I SAM-dependent RNA methyltransferase, partial [Planctomycetes bacterium]|nr:RsmB/NOP family class I SAM-dependent RNA methyltransferase [Planctomycetota bacterium]